jgi:F-type H+-transporting ATPase subunit a
MAALHGVTEGTLSEDARPETDSANLRWSSAGFLVGLLFLLIAIDAIALILFPPYDPRADVPGECAYPVCFINGNLELPAPHVVWRADGPAEEAPTGLVVFDVSISNTLITLWIVALFVLVGFFILTRGQQLLPHRRQNLAEWAYETIADFGESLGGSAARPYIPLFIGFFLLILFSNWSGLVPPIGKVEFLRAPTSDVNVTIGLALVAFLYFEFQGFKALGIGYLGKFFPFGEFRKGIGAGFIAVFVGLIELLLELVKPVTLSMRLFGNIYGGEVALGVMTALTIALIPVGLFALEVILNLIQALIFSTLTLIFTLTAIESHAEHEDTEPHATPVEPDLVADAAASH